MRERPGDSGLAPYTRDTRPRFVAFRVHARLVEEHRFIRTETGTNGGDDIAGTGEATLAISDTDVSLSAVGVEPSINESEIRTAVIDLVVPVPSGLPGFEDRH